MRMTFRTIGWGAVGTLFLLAPLFAFSAERTTTDTPTEHNWAYTEEATNLLKHVRSLSGQLAQDADSLTRYSRQDRLDSTSHAVRLNQIRNHVNAMGKSLMRLEEIQGMIAPWQQKALHRITPHAVALAERAEEAIDYHIEQADNFWVPAYTESVGAMSDHAEEINESATLFLDHAEGAERLEALERQLEYAGA